MIKNLPAMRETRVQSLGQEDALEKGMATHSRILVCLITQLCLTPCDPMDCSQPGSPVRGILQARILESVTMHSSRGSSQPKDQTQVSHIAGRFFTIRATREAQEY